LKQKVCRECGAAYEAQRTTREFCGTACRKAFHNRAALRGVDLFHLFMSMRFDRANAEAEGVWSLMCRLAASYKEQDHRERDGRKSFDDVAKVRERNPHLNSTVVGLKVAGECRSGLVRENERGGGR
jgi:hypothetical protein